MKRIKRSVPLLTALFLLSSVPVLAASVKEGERKGSIFIELADGGMGTTKDSVVFEYSKVALSEEGEYVLTEDYKGSGINLNEIKNSEELRVAAEKLAGYGKSDGQCRTDKEGKAAIENLDMGVYVFYVSEQAKYDKIAPTLVSIPTWDETEGNMVYEVHVCPKHTTIPEDDVKTAVKTGDSTEYFLKVGLLLVYGIVCGCELYKKGRIYCS